MSPGFIHLHLHSEYSLIDSTIRIPALVEACVRAGMPAVALTDQANLFALVKFQKRAEAAGIKPIFGADLWLGDPEEPGRPARLTVLCRNHDGYLNLSRLLTRAYAENHRGDYALVEPEWFGSAASGLVAIAGHDSDLGRALLANRDELAQSLAERWRRRFPESLYLEVARTGRAHDEPFLGLALDLGARLELPLIASNDVRFLERTDFEAHEARVCIQSGRVLSDPRRPHDYSPEQYLKSPQEMAVLFADLPELLENTVELAKRCSLELATGTYFLPEFPRPPELTLGDFIRQQARVGLEQRLAQHQPSPGHGRADYDARLEHELDVIVEMDFPGYFLIVADFINWAKQNGIPVGPGRGSGAGSLVAWSLGITDLDPLRYNLLFERFLNRERVSMPDFDVDFCMDRRDEVIDYVSRKYGRERVSQIITYGSMAARAVLRDSGRVLGMPYGQVDRVAKLLPRMPLDLSLEDALGRSAKSREEPGRVVAELCAAYAEDSEVGELVDLALKLENLTRNAGKHAGGVVIAPKPLSEFAPLFSEQSGAPMVTQFDKDDVEAIGLVKFDFLGLRTLTIIDRAVKAINGRRNAGKLSIDIAAAPLDDPAVFDLFRNARTGAVFQFESRGMQNLLRDARPDCFEDLIALVSLYRPGPMDLIPDYCARKRGRAAVVYPDPRVEPILRETCGIMVYQEQVMQMAQIVGGYTLGGADLLRRAMGKKKPEEMARERVKFRAGALERGLDEAKADSIFDLMEKFAGYGFNKSHAAAYALVAYQTAWLKAHYPAEFMAAVLSCEMGSVDKLIGFLGELRALDLKLLPPDVNASGWTFEAVDAGALHYGLGAIRGVGRGAVDAIVAARESGGPFRDLLDFCLRVDPQPLNRRVLEALIQSGAMDALGANRATLSAQLPEALRAAEQALRNRQSGQVDLFGGERSAPLAVELPTALEEWPLAQRLNGERETLGHYLSGHPTDAWRSLIDEVVSCPIGELGRYCHAAPRRDDGEPRRGRTFSQQSFTLAGEVGDIRRQGDARCFVRLEDHSGVLDAVLYSEALAAHGELLRTGAILVFTGNVGLDAATGGYEMRVQSVRTLEDACAHRARLLRLRLDDSDVEFSRRLVAILTKHRGGATPVRLSCCVSGAEVELELGDAWRVRAIPSLAASLRGLDGVLEAELLFR